MDSPTLLSPDRYLELLGADGGRLAAAARRDLAAAVPGCPDWDVAALVAHTGTIHRWVTEIVRSRARERVSRRGLAAPPEGAEIVWWFEEGLAALRDALVEAGPEARVWNWTEPPAAPVLFWFRRMAQETAVHRWDAQSATGDAAPVATELAVDGISEILETFLPLTAGAGNPPAIGGSLHVHTTDTEGEWTVRPVEGGLDVERGHGKGDAALRGPASDVLLALWSRPTLERVEVFGDEAVVGRWRELVRL